MSSFRLSYASMRKLDGVHMHLKLCVINAIDYTDVDFMVHEGLRPRSKQAQLVKSGASQTLDSRHIATAAGIGHAVDLVPVIDFDGNGKAEPRWDWPLCYRVAAAMRRAATELNVPVRWGGVWDLTLADLGESAADMEDAVAAYVARRKAAKLRAFIDGPHFELPKSLYP